MLIFQANMLGQSDAEQAFDAGKTDDRIKENYRSIKRIDIEIDEINTEISDIVSQLSIKLESSSIDEVRIELQSILDSINNENNKTIESLESEIRNLNSDISKLERKISELGISINDNSKTLSANLESINTDLSNELSNQRSSLDELVSETDSLGQSLVMTNEMANESVVKGDENYLYIQIAIGVILFLLIVSIIMYRITQSNKRNLEQTSQDVSTLHSLQQGLEKLLVKQNEIISKGVSGEGESKDILPLVKSLADDIVKLDNIIFMMDPNAKGLKHIKRTVKSQRTNLKIETGYDVPNLLGVEVKPGEHIDFENTQIDPSLEIGVKIISRVIKPKILKDGELIQKPKVEIRTNNG